MGPEPGLQPRRPSPGRRSVDSRIRIGNAGSGELLLELTGHQNSVNDLAFHQRSGTELVLASAGDYTVRLWHLTGRMPRA